MTEAKAEKIASEMRFVAFVALLLLILYAAFKHYTPSPTIAPDAGVTATQPAANQPASQQSEACSLSPLMEACVLGYREGIRSFSGQLADMMSPDLCEDTFVLVECKNIKAKLGIDRTYESVYWRGVKTACMLGYLAAPRSCLKKVNGKCPVEDGDLRGFDVCEKIRSQLDRPPVPRTSGKD